MYRLGLVEGCAFQNIQLLTDAIFNYCNLPIKFNHAKAHFLVELNGVLIVGAATFGSAFTIFWLVNKLMGVRVSVQHEIEGMDSHEHGISGYAIVYKE